MDAQQRAMKFYAAIQNFKRALQNFQGAPLLWDYTLKYRNAQEAFAVKTGGAADLARFLRIFEMWPYITTCFAHNFFKSPRIDFRFFTVAKLKKLNNFYLGRIEDWPIKNSRNRVFTPYLARARARARPSPTSWELGLRPSPTRGSHREPTRGARLRISATHFAHVAFRARGRCFFRDFDSQRVVTQLSANSMEHIYTNALKKCIKMQGSVIGRRGRLPAQRQLSAPADQSFL